MTQYIDTTSKRMKEHTQQRKPLESTQTEIDQDDAWTVIKAYFKQHGLVSQQISSFNRFVNISIQDIISENGEIQIEVQPQYLVSKSTNSQTHR